MKPITFDVPHLKFSLPSLGVEKKVMLENLL